MKTNYFHADGLPDDRVKAFELYLKATEQGQVDAQYLGLCYANGDGVTQI